MKKTSFFGHKSRVHPEKLRRKVQHSASELIEGTLRSQSHLRIISTLINDNPLEDEGEWIVHEPITLERLIESNQQRLAITFGNPEQDEQERRIRFESFLERIKERYCSNNPESEEWAQSCSEFDGCSEEGEESGDDSDENW